MTIYEDAAQIDEILMANGVINFYMFSAKVMERPHETMEERGQLMKNMNDDVVAICFAAGKPAWPIFEASGLAKHMGYYFQTNSGPPQMSGRSRSLRCLETGEHFTSAALAAQSIGCAASTLYAHLNGKLQSVFGRTYAWDGEGRKPHTPKPPGRAPRRVRCVESGEEWASATQASIAIGCAVLTMYAHLRRDLRYPKVGGRIYQYSQTGE